ncbi:MAG: Lrp/AsnC family transcriptional regulator [Lachnospiraceae bacterium]|nr:Lrp/AsnC family transcriptional regulator [Lachnospiraceae bacterium]
MKEKILKAIDKNSKLTAKELAMMLGSTEEEIEKNIKEMEENHVICGYPTLINWDCFENERVTAIIEVKVTPQRGQGFDKIAERIYRFEEVTTCYLVSGNYDLAVIIEGRSMREIANFVAEKLSPLEAVVSCATNFVLRKYKEHGMPLVGEAKEDERMLITP